MDNYCKHYIRLDAGNNITHGFSDAFEQPQDGDICISEQGGRHFEIPRDINPPLQTMQGIYLYRYIDGQIVAKTPEEIQAEIDSLPPVPTQPSYEEISEALNIMLGVHDDDLE